LEVVGLSGFGNRLGLPHMGDPCVMLIQGWPWRQR
jgi:hypothetical protein